MNIEKDTARMQLAALDLMMARANMQMTNIIYNGDSTSKEAAMEAMSAIAQCRTELSKITIP